MKRLFLTAGLLVLIVGVTSKADAQETEHQPLQEVFQTELVYPQENGAFQLTSAFTFGRVNRRSSNELTLEYGLTESWQIDLQWESLVRKEKEDGLISLGPGDLRVGTKYSFMNIVGSNFHSAVGFELGLPASSAKKELSDGKIEYEPYVVVAKDFPSLSRLQLFSQLGITFAHTTTRAIASDDNHDGKTIEWNSGMFVPYRQAAFTTEINWSRGASEKTLYLTPGIIWKLPHDLELGVGIPIGLGRNGERVRTIVKFVYEFGSQKPAGKRD